MPRKWVKSALKLILCIFRISNLLRKLKNTPFWAFIVPHRLYAALLSSIFCVPYASLYIPLVLDSVLFDVPHGSDSFLVFFTLEASFLFSQKWRNQKWPKDPVPLCSILCFVPSWHPVPLWLFPSSLFRLALVLFLLFLQLKFLFDFLCLFLFKLLCPFSLVFSLIKFCDFFLSFRNYDFVFLLYQITYMLSDYVYFLVALKFF